MNEQVYKKKGKRYIPIGYSNGFTGFPVDGIWIVQTKDRGKSSECMMRIGELQDMQPAINLILGYKEKIMKYISDYNSKSSNSGISLHGVSLNDFVLDMLKEITKNN